MYNYNHENQTSKSLNRSVQELCVTDLGIRLYKDDEILQLKEEDTCNMCNILLFKSGMYSKEWGFKKSGLYIAPEFIISESLQVGDEFKGYLLSIPFSSWKTLDIYNLDDLFEVYVHSSYIELSQMDVNMLEMLMNILKNAVGNSDSSVSSLELTHVCRAVIATIYRCYSSSLVSGRHPGSGNRTVDKFLLLLENHCLEEKRLDFYSKRLHVSPKYLSCVVSRVTGKKANSWIAEYVLVKVNEKLLATTCSILEVARYAGFEHCSEFCRFYRKNMGITPMAYRKQNRVKSLPQD